MDEWLDRHLTSSHLLDCRGHVTHTFTLLLNGMVRVRTGRFTVEIDPVERRVRTPGVHLPAEVIDHACSLDATGR